MQLGIFDQEPQPLPKPEHNEVSPEMEFFKKLDSELSGVLDKYQEHIIDNSIKGSVYSKMYREAFKEAHEKNPSLTPSTLTEYFLKYKGIKVVGFHSKSEPRVVKKPLRSEPKREFRVPSSGERIGKDAAAGEYLDKEE